MKQLPALVAELGPLIGAQLQKLRAPAPEELVLQLRCPGASHFLLLCWEQGLARLHLCARPEVVPGQSAGGFVRRVRQELLGARFMGACCSPSGDAVWLELKRAEQERSLFMRFEDGGAPVVARPGAPSARRPAATPR